MERIDQSMHLWGVEFGLSVVGWQTLLYKIDRAILQKQGWGIAGNQVFILKTAEGRKFILRQLFAPIEDMKKTEYLENDDSKTKATYFKKCDLEGKGFELQRFTWDWSEDYCDIVIECENGQFTKL